MKIGLLTYYGDLNCGTNLQAYATLQVLRDLYPHDDVEIIPFHSFKPSYKPYLSSISIGSLIRDARRLCVYRKFIKEDLGVKKDRIIVDVEKATEYIAARNYDVIYVGADTLLELDRINATGYDGLSVYWLSPKIKATKCLVAASSKNVDFEHLSKKQKEEMKASLNGFSYWGVRDTGTYALISHFVDEQKIEYVPDPTFAMSIDYTYIEKRLKQRNISITEKSILFHTNRTDSWCKEVARQLKADGYKIYSLRPAYWADVQLNDLTPLEQLGIYSYFSLVITHRFHDAIFCLKNDTPMLLYAPNSKYTNMAGESKFSSLLKHFNLFPSNMLTADSITPEVVLTQIPTAIKSFKQAKQAVAVSVEKQKELYKNYLKRTLSKKKGK